MLPVGSLHTVLICDTWEACISFYRDTLGFPVVYERERFVESEVTPSARIGIRKAGVWNSGLQRMEYKRNGTNVELP